MSEPLKVFWAGKALAVGVMLLSAGLPTIAGAQAPAVPSAVQTPLELRFDITRYRVEGNTLLPPEELERIVSAYTGKGRDFGDVQRALEALQEAYRDRGYSAVQVYLPEQELAKGEVVLRVIEAKVSRLEVRGNKFFDEANIRRSLPSLAEGTTPNANLVAKNLALANENPAKQTNVTLRAGAKEGEVDARVDVVDENPQKWFVTLDNTGTPATGYDRVGLGYQNANLFGLDHAMTLQAVTSPERPSRVGIYSVGYHLPLYAQGASMDFVAGYSDVDAGTTQTPSAGPLAFSGRGGVLGARYNWHLDHFAGYDHRVIFGLDYRDYRNTCTLGIVTASCGGPASATFSLTPVSVTYAGTLTQSNSRLGLNAGLSTNLGVGSKGDAAALENARAGANVHYWVLRGGLDYAQALPEDWQVRGRLLAQYTNQVLVAPEQFGIGGAYSVRGFLERELANDQGHSGTVEVYTPELAPHLGMKDWNARALAFYDFGRIARVNPLPGEQVREGIASAGVGLRLAYQKSFSLRFDLAQIVDPGGTRERNSVRFAFGTVWAF